MVLNLPIWSFDSLWTLRYWILIFFCLFHINLKWLVLIHIQNEQSSGKDTSLHVTPKLAQILYIKITTATTLSELCHFDHNSLLLKHKRTQAFFICLIWTFTVVKLSCFTLVNWSCSCLIVFSLWLCTTLACWNIFCCCLNICCWNKIKICITCMSLNFWKN